MPFLIGVIILITFITIIYIYIRIKIKKTLNKYGLNSINEIIEKARLEDEELPKSLSSMDSIYMPRFKEDFPSVNINELKRTSEKIILEALNAIETKNSKNIKNEKVKAFVDSKIEDLKKSNIKYDSIKIHKTVVSKYEKEKSVATLYLSTSLEYFYQKDNSIKKKVQDRFKLEFIYIIDASNIEEDKRAFAINCPNCGAPIRNIKTKNCEYCGSNIIDIVKKAWICNDIIEY